MRSIALFTAAAFASASHCVHARPEDPDQSAARVEQAMTDDERYSLVWGYMPIASRLGPAPTPPSVKAAAGYFPAIPRLGFHGIYETDASLGVTNPKLSRPGDVATALPSGLSLAATFNPALAYESGAMIGAEARAKGFNVMLAGGVNLTRDWFGGRNFEYLGEDPLLAGRMAGQSIRGVQSQGLVSTAKHFILNSQETLRHSLDVRIAEAALRESDLLAFQIALEIGQPGAVMCAYNKVNGAHGCNNDWLLNKVLRQDWGFKGWVMSDWGATHGPDDIMKGLDQESGAQLDKQVWFDKPLRQAIADGTIPHDRLSTSVRRILRSLFAAGAYRPLTETPIDYAANAAIARRAASEGIVLLKNEGVLPLAKTARNILVVGRYTDRGVWSGGGSSQVNPVGGAAVRIPVGGSPFLAVSGAQVIMPSSPLEALKKQLPQASITFDTGLVPEFAAAKAARADMVVIFAHQWQVESLDSGSLSLSEGQDQMIDMVASANPNAVLVLETGNPVAMPWLGKLRGVVQAWYSGQQGGEAIADVLTGQVNPSGRLPITYPVAATQAPRGTIPGFGLDDYDGFSADYVEGSDVGYRWYAKKGETPLFPFGFGLSYSRFEHDGLKLSTGKTLRGSVQVRNTGDREGADVPQLYLVARNGERLLRLASFAKVTLKPGEARQVAFEIDPRILADWSGKGWTIAGGRYAFAVGHSAGQLGPTLEVKLPRQTLKP